MAEESNRPFIDRSLGTSVPAACLPAPNPSFGHTHDVLLMCVFNRFPSMPICRGETSFPSPVTVTHWLIEFGSGKVNLHLGRVPDGPPHWTRPKDKGHGNQLGPLIVQQGTPEYNKTKPVFLLRRPANKRGKADGSLDEGHLSCQLAMVNPKGFGRGPGVCKTGFPRQRTMNCPVTSTTADGQIAIVRKMGLFACTSQVSR